MNERSYTALLVCIYCMHKDIYRYVFIYKYRCMPGVL
jgi:hypothetical protein